jgi:hypothetical protein
MSEHLRPLERRVLAMRDEGVPVDEIARRLRRSPGHVERIIRYTELPRSGPPARRLHRALERRVLALRDAGETYDQIGDRFRKGGRFIRQIEGLAHFTKGLRLLEPTADAR